MSSDTNAKVQWNNQAGRDNHITQTQTIIYNGSVWILISISFLLILRWRESRKREVAKRLKSLEEQLRPRIIENVSYGDQAKRRCDPETRKDVLQGIISWIDDISEESECFYWLYGGPGVGKSTIAASIAEHCLDRHILGAQFFINRDDVATTDPRTLFPTLSYQLCQRFPYTVAVVVEEIIRAQPSLLNEVSKEQATKLFVAAIDAAAATDRTRVVMVVIDALDEADPKRLWDLAQILSTVVVDLPRNAKVFVTSRGENAIVRAFEPLRNCKRVKIENLATSSTKEEVSRFMKKKVEEILEEYGIDWAKWGDDRMRRFSSPASGLYIWAQTALSFLRAGVQNSGNACFEEVLGTLAAKGIDDIDNLYLGILQRTCTPGDWEYERFHRIVGAILVRQAPLSIRAIAQLLDLKHRSTSEPVDVVHFVRQYRTVLVNDTKEIDDRVVPRLHKSFADFVTSERAQKFRVSESESHGEMALRCMSQLDDLIPYLKRGTPHSFPTNLLYVSQHWQLHLTRIVEPDTCTNDAEEENECDILIGNDTKAAGAFSRDSEHITHQLETISFAFSPDNTQIASSHTEGTIRIWNTETGLKSMSLVGHESGVWSIGFSPNGTQLVSASTDGTARIWDAQTGSELYMLRGHTNLVIYVGYSHNGKTVVTSSTDSTVRTYDTSTGQQLNIFRGQVYSTASHYCEFSQNDQYIASCSAAEIIVWDANSGVLIFKFKHDGCRMISFCPCGDHLMGIISCDDDDAKVKLWDVKLGIRLIGKANSGDAQRLAFVKDSEQESASGYIEVPPALKRVDGHTPQLYYLNTEHGKVHGIVENGQGTWVLEPKNNMAQMLYFDAGATRC